MSRSIHTTHKTLKGLTKAEIDNQATDPDSNLVQLATKRALKKAVKQSRKNQLLTLFMMLLVNVSFGQVPQEYLDLVEKAWGFYETKDYKQSAATYHKAFDLLDGKAVAEDRYDAACSYALAGNADSSLYHLKYLATTRTKYRNYGHITTDPDLKSLRGDDRWKEVLELVLANKEEYEKDFDKPLVLVLDHIHETDQRYRNELDDIVAKYGHHSQEVKDHWGLINYHDSVNLVQVKKILDERGWLGPEVIGSQGNTTLFLVIQHADIETQVQYLPMMRQAVKDKKANASSLALLEDRVALRQGKRQIYGSQVMRDSETGEWFVRPLEDPEHVNERRASVGLQPIEAYIKHWDMTWDVKKHKARTAKMESQKK